MRALVKRRRIKRELIKEVKRGAPGEYSVEHFLTDVLRHTDHVEVDMWSLRVRFADDGTIVIEPPAAVVVSRDGEAYLQLFDKSVPVKELPKPLAEEVKRLISIAEHVKRKPIKDFVVHLKRDV